MPLQNDLRLRFVIVGRPLDGPYHGMGSWRSVSIDYFDALGIPLLRGRRFTEQDRLGAPGVVIINERMARQFWRDGDPLNDRVLIGKGLGPQFAGEPVRRIVGVVGDVRDAALETDPRPTTYVPIAQLPDGVMRQTMGMAPLTGVPLPFVSYGNSNLVVLLAGMGLLLNVALHGVQAAKSSGRRGRLKAIGVGTFLYALLYLIEGIGLLLRKHWAEYFTVIMTGLFIPLEIYEVARKVTTIRVGLLAINKVT